MVVLLDIILSILFPIFLLLAFSLFFLFYSETLADINLGKREVGLLIIGSASTMFFDFPLIFYNNYFIALNIGGAFIPLILSFYFIYHNNFSYWRLVVGISLISLVSYMVTDLKKAPTSFITHALCLCLGNLSPKSLIPDRHGGL